MDTFVAVQYAGQIRQPTVNGNMIAPDYLKRIAAWSRELNEREIEIARAGIVEKSYRANEFIFMRGDNFEYWTGVVTGLARMGIVSRGGKAASFAGLTAGAWFGEGTVLKNEARRYDVVYLPSVEIIHHGRVSTRQNAAYAAEHIFCGFARYLRKTGCSRRALFGYKLAMTVDAPLQLVEKGVQYLWRRLWGQHEKAAKSLLVFVGLLHFLRRGLLPLWKV